MWFDEKVHIVLETFVIAPFFPFLSTVCSTKETNECLKHMYAPYVRNIVYLVVQIFGDIFFVRIIVRLEKNSSKNLKQKLICGLKKNCKYEMKCAYFWCLIFKGEVLKKEIPTTQFQKCKVFRYIFHHYMEFFFVYYYYKKKNTTIMNS